MDSGFYSDDILGYLEERPSPINYIVATPMYSTVQRAIASQHSWMSISNGIDIVEFEYQVKDWLFARRMIAVRQKIEKRPKAVGKQLSLFENDWQIDGYRYTCYVTNLNLPAPEVWRLYRGRANCENRIKELKYDYGLDKINEQSFDTTEATLLLVSIAYNFMSLVKQLIIGGNVRHRLSTLRYKVFAIPASIENEGSKIIVNMALQMNRRLWIRKLWDKIEKFTFETS